MAGIIAGGAITLSMACSGGLLCADWLNFTRPSCGHVGHGGGDPAEFLWAPAPFLFWGAVAGGLSVGDSDCRQSGATHKDPQDGGVKGSERADNNPKLRVTGRALALGQGGRRPNENN